MTNERQSAPKPQGTKYLLKNIPASLHKSVKIFAAKRGESIRALIIRLLIEEVSQDVEARAHLGGETPTP